MTATRSTSATAPVTAPPTDATATGAATRASSGELGGHLPDRSDHHPAARPLAPAAAASTAVPAATQAAPAPETGPADAPPRPAPAPAATAAQVVAVVAPLRRAGDGQYTLSLRLHPAELGPVTVGVELRQGTVSLHLATDSADARAALHAALPELRAQLAAQAVPSDRIVVAPTGPDRTDPSPGGWPGGGAGGALPDGRQQDAPRPSYSPPPGLHREDAAGGSHSATRLPTRPTSTVDAAVDLQL